MTRPPPTPASLLRNVLQAIMGLLDLSIADDAQVTIPRFYLEVWQQQLETVLAVIEDPLAPDTPFVLIAIAALAFGLGVLLGFVLGA